VSLESLLTSNEETPYNGKEYQPSLCIRTSGEANHRRQRYAQKRKADRQAVAAYLKARDAALPWPVRAVDPVLDFVLRRPRS